MEKMGVRVGFVLRVGSIYFNKEEFNFKLFSYMEADSRCVAYM